MAGKKSPLTLALAELQQGTGAAAQRTYQIAELYARHIPVREVPYKDPAQMVGHLRQVAKTISQHKPDEIYVKVHNPPYTQHTVVEVLMKDQPFLIDTVWMRLHERGLAVHHSFHPLVTVQRTPAGALKDIQADAATEDGWQRESFMHVEIDRQSREGDRQAIALAIEKALQAARQAYADFPEMIHKLEALLAHAEDLPPAQREENLAFLRWLLQNNFIFLGYRYYKVEYPEQKDAEPTIQAVHRSGLGILQQKSETLAKRKIVSQVAENLQSYLVSPSFLTITKTLQKSPVHRRADMAYVGIRSYNAEGRTIGEHRFVGLFTSKAYTTPAREIPIVRQKIRDVLAMEKTLPTSSYNYKALQNILDTYPRDELFQIEVKDLHRIATGILHLQERQQVRVFINRSARERLVTALVYLPLERMNSQQRVKIQNILMSALDGESFDFHVLMGDGALARLFFYIRTRTHQPLQQSEHEIEAAVATATLGWVDNLRQLLIRTHGEDNGIDLFTQYEKVFRAGYQDITPESLAVEDIALLESFSQSAEEVIFTYHQPEDDHNPHLRVFNKAGPIPLSAVMPLMTNMGLIVTVEHPFKLHDGQGNPVWLHDFELVMPEKRLDGHAQTLAKALTLIWQGKLEDDPLNALMIKGGLDVDEVVIMRMLVAYVRQIASRYGQDDMQRTLLKHPHIAKMLAELFISRFNPALSRKVSDEQQQTLKTNICTALQQVSVLAEDQILQRLQDVILATVRTNAWQRQTIEDTLAIKIDSTRIPGLMKPVPWREIFVYSAAVEGVHLRGGPVARGGLRWSDRPTDYRVEVLGLMKAQMTKNVVIVPVGAKGGFFVKKLPQGDRATVMAQVEECYRRFVRALLSLTDNRINGTVVRPRHMRRYDGDDAYLVVAADKGTATFSDIANQEAQQADYWPLPEGTTQPPGFWLGDAFASGGSQGYDHKKMGITARGAWESVKHHFRRLGKDIQQEDFTVVGIGDMAGDVFGNGMLLSKHIQLIGAFNHKHIFVDPNPNAAATFKERQRLFTTPNSTWADFNPKVLSKGGCIYERAAKQVKLTPEIKARLGLSQDVMQPNELIRALLTAEVELLWNGGIGTYIKARQESHQDVADRANDDLRINGSQVRAKVIGEGGNLGVTQLGRVEYALHGGHINTDAVDNAGGVNTSDVEVNIKILLSQAAQPLPAAQRNSLLEGMTDDVAKLVLRSNYLQAQAITLKERIGVKNIDTAWRLQQTLSHKGHLDPALEFLPDADVLENRKRDAQGYTRPELSVLMAYTKAHIYDEILASTLPDDPTLAHTLHGYFPADLQDRQEDMLTHPLQREIIATLITNELVNRMGLTFLNRLQDETGADVAEIASAYLVSSRLLEADHWWQMVEALDGTLSADVQFEMYDIIKLTIEFSTFWFLRQENGPLRIEATLRKYQSTFNAVYDQLETTLSGHKEIRHHQRVERWQTQGLKPEMAHAMALVSLMVSVPDIARLVQQSQMPVPLVMQTYFAVGERLQLARLHTLTRSIAVTNNWERVASQSIIDALYHHQSWVTAVVLAQNKDARTTSPNKLLEQWLQGRLAGIRQYDERLGELQDQPVVTHAMMNVILGQLKAL